MIALRRSLQTGALLKAADALLMVGWGSMTAGSDPECSATRNA